MARARVLIRPKAGILDPQGQAVERALPALGFAGVRQVHVGRLVELELDDPAQLPRMCEQLLTNPLIEEAEVVVLDSGTSTTMDTTSEASSPGGERRGDRPS